ncbi:MAG: glycosyltransferase family protein [Nitrospirota bacterium]
MKILVTSYCFYPENTPRAFRTYELVKEFARQGHDVTVYIPDSGFDYTGIEARYGFHAVKVKPGFLVNKNGKNYLHKKTADRSGPMKEEGAFNSKLRKLRRRFFLNIYFDGRQTEYAFTLAKNLLSNNITYDAVISVGLPFSVHVGTAAALYLRKTLARIRIADYGDPFSKNEHRSDLHRRWHYWFEKFILRAFDYITVPIDAAVSSYLDFKEEGRIKVIPQGICLDEINVTEYQKNKVPTFIYGGNFYRRLRNPQTLLDFLVTIDEDFKFIIYTDMAGVDNMAMIRPFMEKLGSKFEVRDFIPRLDFIMEASKADFLVNFSNLSANQLPSKIIDYALSGRPIFNCGQEDFSPLLFKEFLRGEYGGGLKIHINDYDIRIVCEKFFRLITPMMGKT